jgi:hypothetical protein
MGDWIVACIFAFSEFKTNNPACRAVANLGGDG